MAKKKHHKKAAAKRIVPRPRRDSLKPAAGLPPGMVFVPGTPGVPTPTPEPFFTPDDLLAINDYQTNEAGQLQQIDSNLEAERIQKEYDLTQTQDSYRHNVSAATDEMIGRGLFASSVKDAALYDMEATFGLQRSFLNDRFNQVLTDASQKKDLILGAGGARERFWAAMNARKVQNAQDLGATQDPFIKPPTEGHFQPVPQVPKPPAPKPAIPTTTPRGSQLRGPGQGFGQNRPYVSPMQGGTGHLSNPLPSKPKPRPKPRRI